MKKILHSGEFIDYNGNTIRVTFYEEKHLWVSRTTIQAGAAADVYEVEVWSDVGDAFIRNSKDSWIADPTIKKSYTNNDGHKVFVYEIAVAPKTSSNIRKGDLEASVNIIGDVTGYDDITLTKTITISQ